MEMTLCGKEAMVSKRIATKCPACHNSTLAIGGGNWLVCSLIGCPDPTRINSVGDRAASHFDELQALRDERDRLRAVLGQATIALRYYAKTAISARAVEALEKMEKAQVFACFYCSQDHLWLASQDGWHATKKEGLKVRCEAKAALTPAGGG